MIARLFGIVGFLVVTGCVSQTLPPRPSADLLAASASTHFPLTVGVEPYDLKVYSRDLITELRRTGLFERVDSVDAFATPPDIIARVENVVSGSAAFPLWTFLTLGIIPTTVNESWGNIFSLRSSAAPTEAVPVNFSYDGPTTLGWAALFLNLLPDRAGGNVKETDRYIEGLRAQIVAHASEIRALAKP